MPELQLAPSALSHSLVVILKYYPLWALPGVLMLAEMAAFFHRKNRIKGKRYAIALAIVLAITIGVWFAFRGFANSERWVKALLGGIQP